MNNQYLQLAIPRLQSAYQHLLDEFKGIRSGRATPALVDSVQVSYWDQQVPLKQIASISTPDAQTIAITPWDPQNSASIEKAIREDVNLDLNPVSDGKMIHIKVGSLTEERRQQLVKQVAQKVEECFVAMRNIRHDILNQAKQSEKNKEVSEDDYTRIEKELTAKLDEFRKQVEEAAEHKKTEIMEV
jgi:ribosome recycling factor